MHTLAAQAATEVAREAGAIRTVVTRPGMGAVTTLFQTLADHGLDAIELEGFRVAEMSDMQLASVLNGALMSDKVVIMSGLDRLSSLRVETRRALAYVTHGFADKGGRAVLVAYQ